MRNFVVIVTYGRSGSTVLQRVLNTIPDCCIRGENNNVLFYLYQSLNRLAQGKKIAGGGTQNSSHPWWGMHGVDIPTYRARLAKLFLEEVLHPDANASIVGFKEIRYHEMGDEFAPFLEFIRESFVNVRFVFNTRNIEQTLRSGWWATLPEAQVRAVLQNTQERFRSFAKANENITYMLDYQDLVDQSDVLWNLFHFLGATPDKAAVAAVLAERLIHARGGSLTGKSPLNPPK